MDIKSRQLIFWKTGFLTLTLVAIAACSNSFDQTQVPNAATTNADDSHSMTHSGMDHSTEHHNMAMALGSADADYDLRFIDAMRLHHQGAIAMAKEAEQKSQRPEIKSLARNIIKVQNREENELLRKWRQDWYPKADATLVAYGGEDQPTVPMSEEQKQSMIMQMDLGDTDEQFDLRFMNAMITHHEAAISMAQDAIEKSQRPEIKQLSREIMSSQQIEIDQMKQWRKAWYQ